YIEVARAIKSADKIYIFGVGASGAVAIFLQYKLTRSGYPAVAITDPHMQAILAANMNSRDLAIGIKTVAITEHKNSPISKYSSVIIETFSSENPIKNSAGRSVLAQIYAIELLTGILQLLDYGKSKKFGEETAKAVIKKLY
ncbi:MAG: hypothetical protein PWQ85_1349, partial [Geotoga sp.]|nr:hypothetical protein [Geotoga sp.]